MKTFIALLSALTIAALAGCGSDDPEQPPGNVPTSGVLVEYQATNGLARSSRTLVVNADGSAEVDIDGRATTVELSEGELKAFQDAVGEANFPNLDERYEQTEEVLDASVLEVSSGGKSVVVALPADPPAGLQKVIDLSREQLESATARLPEVPGPSDNVLAYTHSGGVAGVDEALYIRPDGAARVEIQGKATRFELTDAELAELNQAIDAAGFTGLAPEYKSGSEQVSDGFVDMVTAEGRTVTVADPAEPPPALGELIAVAGGYLERYR